MFFAVYDAVVGFYRHSKIVFVHALEFFNFVQCFCEPSFKKDFSVALEGYVGILLRRTCHCSRANASEVALEGQVTEKTMTFSFHKCSFNAANLTLCSLRLSKNPEQLSQLICVIGMFVLLGTTVLSTVELRLE